MLLPEINKISLNYVTIVHVIYIPFTKKDVPRNSPYSYRQALDTNRKRQESLYYNTAFFPSMKIIPSNSDISYSVNHKAQYRHKAHSTVLTNIPAKGVSTSSSKRSGIPLSYTSNRTPVVSTLNCLFRSV